MERGGSGELTALGELSALLRLRLLPGLGDRAVIRLLDSRGSAARVVALPDTRFEAAAGTRALKGRRDPAIRERVEQILAGCDELGIRILSFGGPGYPSSLRELSDPPPVLFLRGRSDLLDRPGVAVVGSRRATPTGRRAAERIGRDLSEAGVAVLSELAFGIDGAAHRGALGGPGGTIAVLGRGPDRAYPRGNWALFDQILDEGLVLSEFPPGEPARPFHFPRRNRVLAALSQAVVVVEAARRSGALITVDHALDLGREVFAVPGSIETPRAEGTNALLRDGAHLLTEARDLLEVMGWEVAPNNRSAGRSAGQKAGSDAPSMGASPDGPRSSGASTERTVLIGCLGPVPRVLDDLIQATGLSPSRALSLLTTLEMEGAARRELTGWTLGGRR